MLEDTGPDGSFKSTICSLRQDQISEEETTVCVCVGVGVGVGVDTVNTQCIICTVY